MASDSPAAPSPFENSSRAPKQPQESSSSSSSSASSSSSSASSSSSSASSFSSSWPGCSSHFRRWIFRPEALQALRGHTHEAACVSLLRLKRCRKRASDTSEVADASASFPSLRSLLDLTEYFAFQLVLICKRKRVKLPVIETACVYLHRFFCMRSPLAFDIRLVIFACLLLALKAEDVARHYSLGDLLGDIAELDIGEVLRLELPVCEALDFHMLVLHTRGPLATLLRQIFFLSLGTERANGSRNSRKRRREVRESLSDDGEKRETERAARGEAAESRRAAVEPPDNLEAEEAEWRLPLPPALRKLQEQSEAEIVLMFVSSTLPLVHPPGVLAVAAVLAAAANSSCAEALAAAGVANVEKLVKLAVCQPALPERTLKRKAEPCDETPQGVKRAKHEELAERAKMEDEGAQTEAAGVTNASAGGEEADEEPEEEIEEIWNNCLQTSIAHIHEELRRIRELQNRVQNQQVGESMGQILEACIDAIEEQQAEAEFDSWESARRGSDDKKEKRKKKEKKKKKRREQTDAPPDDAQRGGDPVSPKAASFSASQINLVREKHGGQEGGETHDFAPGSVADESGEVQNDEQATSSDVASSVVTSSRP
ncbi:cyclin domain protein, cyclin H family protein [Toxoplasma gondii VAND]|uniref:Cyclin domain protein, cyclin H family protein n=1 Tax=Toxoplasma gondii VAND TaxID=933077 RepID=A0A086QDT6_TOXGO|nr:cyclin domain protein, cyclin H family protein [Toxoplasma gondii VAND]